MMKKNNDKDSPGGLVVKYQDPNAGDPGWIPGQGTRSA